MIHSVVGEPLEEILGGVRPFRAPHHASTMAGLLGGGSPIRPGEVSLAHNGVLFLDEIAEFKPSVLQALRQPLESGVVSLTRAEGNVVFPARFTLIAASNPCPCGFHGDPQEACTCSEARIAAYRNRIGGPLIDRMDMRIDVERLDPGAVLSTGRGKSSADLAAGVLRGREYASWRTSLENDASEASEHENGKHRLARILRSCKMDVQTEAHLEACARRYRLSGRGITKTLAVARTIADMAESPKVTWDHLAEALLYRVGENL